MSGMHWEKRNMEARQFARHGESFRRLPGWKDKPGPIGTYWRWPGGVTVHDNASPAVRRQRKARITLPKLTILADD